MELTDSQKDRLRHIPSKFRGTFTKAWLRKASSRRAIYAKCLDCCCYQQTEVRMCTAQCCPLFAYRPKPPKKLTQAQEGTDLPI